MDNFGRAVRTGRLAGWLGREDLELLPLRDALAALGTAHCALHVDEATVPVDAIVGTVARFGDFDRRFRPRRPTMRTRWEAVAEVFGDLPPVRLVRAGDLYFVEDGHHRVSIARTRGTRTVPARVRWICTVAHAPCCLGVADLPVKAAERRFLERVPLPDALRIGLGLDAPGTWSRLAEAAETWGFRHQITDRTTLATAWWTHEVTPVLRSHGVTPTPANLATYVTATLSP